MSQATAGLSDTPRARAPALLRPAVSPASRRARDARVSAAAPAPGALPRGPFGPSQCLPCSAASAQPRRLGQGLAHGTCSILRVNDSFFEKKELLFLVKQETFLQFHINSLDENRLLWCPLRPSPRPPQPARSVTEGLRAAGTPGTGGSGAARRTQERHCPGQDRDRERREALPERTARTRHRGPNPSGSGACQARGLSPRPSPERAQPPSNASADSPPGMLEEAAFPRRRFKWCPRILAPK